MQLDYERAERRRQYPQKKIQFCVLDIERVRDYLAGVERLAHEAARSHDPRVHMIAMAVLAMQPANVRELMTQA